MRIIYWVLVLGVAFGAYYFVQPYIEKVLGAYDTVKTGFNGVQDVGNTVKDFSDVGSLLDSF